MSMLFIVYIEIKYLQLLTHVITGSVPRFTKTIIGRL